MAAGVDVQEELTALNFSVNAIQEACIALLLSGASGSNRPG